MKLFGSPDLIHNVLKNRFDGLPIHKLCYYQSYHPTELVIEQIETLIPSLDVVDCLGMTPLHILACSTKQSLDLYQLIIANNPNSLIIEDEWGCPPLLYAIWGDAPKEIMQFLIVSQKSAFSDHVYDWDKMIENSCRSGVSLDTVQLILGTHQAFFSEQSVNWQKAARELTISLLVGPNFLGDHSDSKDGIYFRDWERAFHEDWGAMMEAFGQSGVDQELVQSLLEIHQRSFSDQNFYYDQNNGSENLQMKMLCEELVQPLKGWWKTDRPGSMRSFQSLVKCSIADRLNAIGLRKWRMNINCLVGIFAPNPCLELKFSTIHSKLVTYERGYPQLKEAAFLLELVLWKFKIDESGVRQSGADTADKKGQCRINCGADIIIPNVLPYLIGI